MTTGLLQLDQISVKRGGRIILDCPRWNISAGEFVGLIGPNGAGKSTFIQCACGLIDPQRGRVLYQGKQINGFFSRSAWRSGIAYIPQSLHYNTDIPFTVREVVAMSQREQADSSPSGGTTAQSIVDHWLSRLGLIDRAEQTFRSLSGGQQQKALLARAMAGEPKLLLLDEPGANLDIRWKKRLSEILEELYHQTSLTVIMVSHDLNLLPPCCRRITLLCDGRIAVDDSPDRVLQGMELRLAYSQEEQV